MFFFLQAECYEEDYTVSGSSNDHSDSEAEIATEVVTSPQGHVPDSKNTLLPVATQSSISPEGSLLHGFSANVTGGGNVSSIDRRSLTPQLTNQRPPINIGQRSKTPGPYDFSKDSLPNRYSTAPTYDREVTQRQRLSKTPDRELYLQHRSSLTTAKRISKSCDSLDSAGSGRQEKRTVREGKRGKLREHRKKGKRAATVHTLDTEQLLLILNLQMRYLQESREQDLQNKLNGNQATGEQGGSRRAITPQPVSQKTVIPQKIRSHTPQPRRANGRIRDSREQSLYSHNVNGNVFRQQRLRSDGGSCVSNSANSSRRTSESSDKTSDLMTSVGNRANGEFVYYQGSLDNKLSNESYLHTQQMRGTVPNIKGGHNPYLHTQIQNTPDNLHYVTYSDSMLNTPLGKPKTRTSVQNHFLPPKPLHRSAHQQLPPQPISRQKNVERQLPPQPVHRNNSAFHVVDRHNKSRSPSINNDTLMSSADSSSIRKLQQDFAEVAIRENFSLNTKGLGSNDTNTLVSENRQITGNPGSNFILRDRATEQTETLPPYSGPPSYKEYVSSCNTSVTSSLSSNPDDVYGLPKRRIGKDSFKTENGVTNLGPSTTNPQGRKPSGNLYKLTGPSSSGVVTRREFNHMQENGESSEGSGSSTQRSNDQRSEVIYTTPAKSRVKQYIVPEDYYTNIAKAAQNRRTYLSDGPKVSSQSPSSEFVYQSQTPTQELNVYQIGTPVQEPDILEIQTAVREPDYGNVTDKLTGYQYGYERSVQGQIGPDARYGDTYEDIYDTILPHRTVNEDVGNTVKQGSSERKVTSKMKSPKKQRKLNPISDVFAREVPQFYHYENGGSGLSNQVTDSVENVHAENIVKIPRIKLNDKEVSKSYREELLDDDEVFVDEESKVYNIGALQKRDVQPPSDTNNQNYEEINDFDVEVKSSRNDPKASDSSQETETGYMKMRLPGKMPTISGSENYGIAIHLTGHSTNQRPADSHVTVESINHNGRHTPDGEDNPVEEDSQEYEETGV